MLVSNTDGLLPVGDPTPPCVLVKICGLTLVEDAAFAAECGADLLGIVVSETSPRRATPDQARAILALEIPQPKYLVFGYDDAGYIESTFRALAQRETRLQIMADHPEIARLLILAPAEKTMPSISASEKINPADIERWDQHALILFDSHRGPHPQPLSTTWRGEPERNFPDSKDPLSPPLHVVERGSGGEGKAGGTGKTFDHTNIAGIRRPYLLAGGLTADNVAEIVAKVHPPGVDVASGVEQSPGVKDRDKVRRFITNAKGAAHL